MQALRYAVCASLSPLLASCLFLLDYDELQGGPAPSASAGGAAGATSGGVGGVGGAPDECGDCDDGDPCTIDTCDETGKTNECRHLPTEGLQLDGLDVTLPGEYFLRTSLVAGGGAFYLSAFEANDDDADVTLYRASADGSELEPLQRLSELNIGAGILSNVGLAVEELALGEVALHGFVGALPKVGDEPRVFHLERRDGEITSNLAGMSYSPSALAFPQARVIGGKVTAAWIQADGTIAVHDAGALRADVYGDASLAATSLSLLSSTDQRPAVMFTAEDEDGAALGTFVEAAGQSRALVAECQSEPGGYVSSSVIDTQIPGIWLANVTRAGKDYLTTGSATLVCASNACTAVAEDCEQADPSNGVRDLAGATVRFETDEPGVIYSVLAVPRIMLSASDSTVDGTLSIVLGRSHFMGEGRVDSSTIGGDVETGLMEIARNETSEELGFAGPDWPSVAILPTRQVLVAWTQPQLSTPGNELRVQRYRMCLPPG